MLQRVPAAAHIGDLGKQEVKGAGQRGNRQQRARPHPLQPDEVLVSVVAGGRDRGRARVLQQPVLALDRAPGAGRQSQRLQQRHGGGDAAGADLGRRGGDGTVRADPAGQRGEQLGHVDRPLAAGRGELGEAEVDQPGAPVLADHDVAAVQRPVRDPGLVQPADLAPQGPGELIGDPIGRDLVQGRARNQVHGQQH